MLQAGEEGGGGVGGGRGEGGGAEGEKLRNVTRLLLLLLLFPKVSDCTDCWSDSSRDGGREGEREERETLAHSKSKRLLFPAGFLGGGKNHTKPISPVPIPKRVWVCGCLYEL